MKDTTYYNAESTKYSLKRYPNRLQTFTQYFFTRRLALTLSMLKRYARPATRLLEVGCADGVVVRAIQNSLPDTFAAIQAVDISPDMISVAESQTPADSGIVFSQRMNKDLPGIYDVIVEIGVLNYLDVPSEIPVIASSLVSQGLYVCSVAGKSSLQYRVKGGDYKDIRSYAEYEHIFNTSFELVYKVPVGFFAPLLWRVPVLARILQPFIEWIGRRIAPLLALEILYVLKKR